MILILALAVCGVARAQAVLVVEAVEGTLVVDGEAQGVPGQALALSEGTHAVWLVDEVGTWNPRIDSTTVQLQSGDTLRVSLALPVRTRVESTPRGAHVTLVSPDGSARGLGTTPLTVDLPTTGMGEFAVDLEGYAPMRKAAGLSPVVVFALAPLPGVRTRPDVQTFETRRTARRRTLIDLGIGAATLAAGAVAVYYKFEADAVDDQYRDAESLRRGDEALRQQALRLDRRSGVALGAMQVGVGVLGLRFVLR